MNFDGIVAGTYGKIKNKCKPRQYDIEEPK